MSEPLDYRAPAPSPPGRPQGWSGTSRMPMQQLGAPPPDLTRSSDYPYPRQRRPGQGGGPPRGGGGKGGSSRSNTVDYLLKGLGLLGVALVSGLLWFLIRNNPAPQPTFQATPPSQSAGLYQFQDYQPASSLTDCADHATSGVAQYLEQHQCVSLTRSLYTTSLADGEKVITSIAYVRMSSSADAKGLKAVSDGNGTGHVKDLVEDGVVIPNGPTNLQNAGYYSAVKGDRVVIVMTEYVDGSLDSSSNLTSGDAALRAVSQDAAKQGIGTS